MSAVLDGIVASLADLDVKLDAIEAKIVALETNPPVPEGMILESDLAPVADKLAALHAEVDAILA